MCLLEGSWIGELAAELATVSIQVLNLAPGLKCAFPFQPFLINGRYGPFLRIGLAATGINAAEQFFRRRIHQLRYAWYLLATGEAHFPFPGRDGIKRVAPLFCQPVLSPTHDLTIVF